MGCNTSKEAMQGGGGEKAEATTASASPPADAPLAPSQNAKVEETEKAMEIAKEAKTLLDDVNIRPEVTALNGDKPETERLESAISQNVENVLAEQAEKGKEIAKKIIKEVSDIDLNDPEANRAATKIQAAFRGHKTRKSMKQGDVESKENLEKEFSSDDKELCEAATKIQASFRGHLVRKSAPRKDEEEELSRELKKLDAKAPEEELDIDLTDPDLQVAATKIQASFRGHRVRKEKQTGGNE